MIRVKVLRVDMRANDPKVIQDELQEQIDVIGKEGLIVQGEVRPLPSPNSALQYFIVTCEDGKKILAVKKEPGINADGETFEEAMKREKKEK